MTIIRNVHLILNDGRADSRLLRETKAIAGELNETEGVEIFAATRGPANLEQIEPRIWLRQIPLKPGQGRGAKFKTAFNLLLWYISALRHALRIGRIVLNVHHAELLPIALTIRLLNGSAIVYVPHELESERAGQRRSKSRAIARIERFAWQRLEGTAVVNESIADEYLALFGGPRPTVIENVQASSVFEGRPKDLHNLANIDRKHKICIYVGALVPNRGLEQLIEWFSSMDQNELALVCMGRGIMESEIQLAAAESKCIHLLPPVPPEEVASYVAGADISAVLIDAVSKNNSLSLPNKFFESVAGGTRVVATPLVELRRFVEAYSVGSCLSESSSKAFVEACRSAMALPRDEFEAGRRRLFIEHGWPVQREKVLSLFREASKKIGKL